MRLTLEQRRSLDTAVIHYERQLAGPALAYVEARGIPHGVAVAYRLGYVGDPLAGHEQYSGRLAIPYLTPAGCVDMRFRCVEAHDCKEHGHGKYMGRPGVTPGLFNVCALWRDISQCAIAEGEIDAMTMDQVLPTVGVPGVKLWQPYWARLFLDYDRVWVLCDGDDPGRELGASLVKQIDSATVVHLPEGQDVNSLYLAGGQQALRKLIGGRL